MTTFSQLVDEIVRETKRPDLAAEIIAYTNQTIREMHFRPDSNAAILYDDNREEILLTADSDTGLNWTIPNIARFQKLETVQYFAQGDENAWPIEMSPGRNQAGRRCYWYRAKDYVVFIGYGGLNSQVGLSAFYFPARLKYQAVSGRQASYDDSDGWTYLAGITTPEAQLAAREATSNWLLLRWHDVITEGVRAKLYKRVSDDSRARTAYSLYAQLRMGVFTSEAFQTKGFS